MATAAALERSSEDVGETPLENPSGENRIRADEAARERRAAKGKGRMTETPREEPEPVPGTARESEEREFSIYPPESANDDEREEKRVADNLKAWSLAEKQRRAKARTSSSSSIVLPSPPSINVIGRTSTLFRQVSTRVRGNSVGSDEARGPERDRARDRRDRGTSIAIPETREESYDGFLKDGSFSPTVASPVTASSPHAASIIGVAGRYSNPFASPQKSTTNRPRSDSELTETSFDPPRPLSTVNSSTLTLERASRFIEDLPTQAVGSSRPNSSSLDPLILNQASKLLSSTETSSSATEFGLAATNPFIDGFQMVDSEPFRDRRDSIISSTSSGGMTTASEGTIMAHSETSPFGNEQRESRPTTTHTPHGVADEMGDYELRTSSIGREARERFDNQQSQKALLEDEDEGKIGVLEWLLCGCWGRDTREDRENSGRTNPNE